MCDSYEYSSSASRDSPHSSAITSAEMPCGTICHFSNSLSEKPDQPASPRFEPIGTRDMFSIPAATTRSRCPAWIAEAAFIAACIDDPHWRSTVVAQTVSGHPAISEATRPTFSACSPTCETQPIWMSSTAPGSMSTRSTSDVSTCAASSSARTEARVPFRFPIGLRTASMITASRID